MKLRCSKCHREMKGTTAYDGACGCGGLIEVDPDSLTQDEKQATLLAFQDRMDVK